MNFHSVVCSSGVVVVIHLILIANRSVSILVASS